jgi:glutamine synthetase
LATAVFPAASAGAIRQVASVSGAFHAIGGVLAHAPALSALLNPTVNSYKRFGPDTLAPG